MRKVGRARLFTRYDYCLYIYGKVGAKRAAETAPEGQISHEPRALAKKGATAEVYIVL